MIRTVQKLSAFALAACLVAAVGGCTGEESNSDAGEGSSGSASTGPSASSDSPTTPPTTSDPAAGATPLEPDPGGVTSLPADQTPIDPGDYDDVVSDAVDDLAEREDVDADDIVVLLDEAVQWPDSSLGCPQAGQAYTQVITVGRRIVLQVGGAQFDYHASANGEAAYCASPTLPTTR